MKRLIVCMTILLLLVSCGDKSYDNTIYLEDYDYLWERLESDYAYLVVAKRHGIDYKEIKDTYREKISKKKMNDRNFSFYLEQMTQEFSGNGHFNLVSRDFYHMARYVYGISSMEPWIEALSKPNSELYYNYEENLFDPRLSSMQDNVSYGLMAEDKIAYLSIDSFRFENIDIERHEIFDFYSQIDDYEHLIIDIRENRGGATRYFAKNIVEPLAKEELYFECYMLYRSNDFVNPFVEASIKVIEEFNNSEATQSKGQIVTLEELPNFDQLNDADVEGFNKVFKKSINYVPSHEFNFSGRIWLLVGDKVYSASDQFAQMCKQTGFATVVGHKTGGDGILLDPVLLSLPNTGIIIRFTAQYGLNINGQNSEEFGTNPDVLVDYDANAYNKVLEMIKNDD